jgi:hypothetical protein
MLPTPPCKAWPGSTTRNPTTKPPAPPSCDACARPQTSNPVGALEERGCGGQAAAGLGPAGRAFQFGGHRFVGPGRGVGQMPRPPIGVGVRIGRHGQCLVRCPPVNSGGRLVDRGADQGMTEPDRAAELGQSGRLGPRGVGGRRAEEATTWVRGLIRSVSNSGRQGRTGTCCHPNLHSGPIRTELN